MGYVSEFPQLAEGVRRLHVRVHEGDVELRVGDGAAWSLDWDAEEEHPPHLVRDGDTLHVKQGEDVWHHGRADVRITAPAGLEGVELHSGSGDVSAAGTDGEVKLHTGDGDVHLRGGSGQAEVRTGSGDLEVVRFEGQLRLSSGSGDVRCVDARGRVAVQTGHGDVEIDGAEDEVEVRTGHGDVRLVVGRGVTHARVDTGAGDVHISGGPLRGLHVRTGAGDFKCKAVLTAGAYEFHTGAGDGEIDLPADALARINVQTGMGEIHSDFPLVRVGRSGPMGFGGARMVGSVGDGEPEIELSMRTGAGSLSIRRAGGARGVHVSPSVVTAGGWEARIDDEAGELTLTRPGESEPMVAVPMPRGIGGFVRRTSQDALGGRHWDVGQAEKDVERMVERAGREAERAVEKATREASRAFGLEGAPPTPPPPPTPRPPATVPASPPAPPSPPPDPSADGGRGATGTPAPSPEPLTGEPSRPVPPQEEATLKVLEALARGEISIDDAQALLNKR